MNSVNSIIPNFESMNDNVKKDILLFGDSRFDENKNKTILEATINFLKNSERFSQSFNVTLCLSQDIKQNVLSSYLDS